MKHVKTFESFLNEGINIDVSPYKRVHGKDPRGNGMWAFEIAGKEIFAPSALNYSDAIRWAKEQAAKEKATTIKVLG